MNSNEVESFAKFLSWEQTLNDGFTVRKVYITISGDLNAGIVLSHIIHYYIRPDDDERNRFRIAKDNSIWIAMSRAKWQDEICLTPKQFDRASGILVKKGLIEKETFKNDEGVNELHVRLNIEEFMKNINEQLDLHISSQISRNVNDVNVSPYNVLYYRSPIDNPLINNLSGNLNVSNTNVLVSDNLNNKLANSKEIKSHKNETLSNPKEMNEDSVNEDSASSLASTQLQAGEQDRGRCPDCGSDKIVSIADDKKGRCAYCLLRAAWRYYFPAKPQPLATTTSMRKMAETRWKDKSFRALYRTALIRSTQSQTLNSKSWFDFEYFVRNDRNFVKMADGWMDWKDDRRDDGTDVDGSVSEYGMGQI